MQQTKTELLRNLEKREKALKIKAALGGSVDFAALMKLVEEKIKIANLSFDERLELSGLSLEEKLQEIDKKIAQKKPEVRVVEKVVEKNIVIPKIRWAGKWKWDRVYKDGDLVEYEGSTWISLIENVNRAPMEGMFWALFARRGKDGEGGPAGDPGRATTISEEVPVNSGDDIHFTISTSSYHRVLLFRGGGKISTAFSEYTISGRNITLAQALNSAAGENLLAVIYV